MFSYAGPRLELGPALWISTIIQFVNQVRLGVQTSAARFVHDYRSFTQAALLERH